MEENIKPQSGRPVQLAFLCILTFIGSGLNMLSNLSFIAFHDQIMQIIDKGVLNSFYGDDIDMSFMAEISISFFKWNVLFFAASLVGAVLIWNLKALGFHIYTLAQIMLLIISGIYLPGQPFPWLNILFSLTFVLLYYKNLRDLGRIGSKK